MVSLDINFSFKLSTYFIRQYLAFQYFTEISMYCTIFAFVIAILKILHLRESIFHNQLFNLATLKLLWFNIKFLCKIIQIMKNLY